MQGVLVLHWARSTREHWVQGLETMRVTSSKGSPEKEVRRSRRDGDELEARRSRRVGEPVKEVRRSRRNGEPDIKEARRCCGDGSEGRRSRGVGDELRRSRGVGDESETCAVKCGEVSAWWGTEAPL